MPDTTFFDASVVSKACANLHAALQELSDLHTARVEQQQNFDELPLLDKLRLDDGYRHHASAERAHRLPRQVWLDVEHGISFHPDDFALGVNDIHQRARDAAMTVACFAEARGIDCSPLLRCLSPEQTTPSVQDAIVLVRRLWIIATVQLANSGGSTDRPVKAEIDRMLDGAAGRRALVARRYVELAREPSYKKQEQIVQKLMIETGAARSTIMTDLEHLRRLGKLPRLRRKPKN